MTRGQKKQISFCQNYISRYPKLAHNKTFYFECSKCKVKTMETASIVLNLIIEHEDHPTWVKKSSHSRTGQEFHAMALKIKENN